MRKLTSEAATAAEVAVQNSTATFSPRTLERLERMLAEVIDPTQLEPLNRRLTDIGRRKLTIADLANIAYVHLRSIAENDGYSPYNRILAFCKRNGVDYDNRILKVATDLLIAVELLKVVDAATGKGKCRRYAVCPDAMRELLK